MLSGLSPHLRLPSSATLPPLSIIPRIPAMTAVLSTVRVSTTSDLRISVPSPSMRSPHLRRRDRRRHAQPAPARCRVCYPARLPSTPPTSHQTHLGTRRAARGCTRCPLVLISDDGHDAEWLAWHLQARGIAGATFLVGGFAALHCAASRPCQGRTRHHLRPLKILRPAQTS